ncbi:MAG: hypothetical protein AAGA56_17985 [Myxococcota bacterium]
MIEGFWVFREGSWLGWLFVVAASALSIAVARRLDLPSRYLRHAFVGAVVALVALAGAGDRVVHAPQWASPALPRWLALGSLSPFHREDLIDRTVAVLGSPSGKHSDARRTQLRDVVELVGPCRDLEPTTTLARFWQTDVAIERLLQCRDFERAGRIALADGRFALASDIFARLDVERLAPPRAPLEVEVIVTAHVLAGKWRRAAALLRQESLAWEAKGGAQERRLWYGAAYRCLGDAAAREAGLATRTSTIANPDPISRASCALAQLWSNASTAPPQPAEFAALPPMPATHVWLLQLWRAATSDLRPPDDAWAEFNALIANRRSWLAPSNGWLFAAGLWEGARKNLAQSSGLAARSHAASVAGHAAAIAHLFGRHEVATSRIALALQTLEEIEPEFREARARPDEIRFGHEAYRTSISIPTNVRAIAATIAIRRGDAQSALAHVAPLRSLASLDEAIPVLIAQVEQAARPASLPPALSELLLGLGDGGRALLAAPSSKQLASYLGQDGDFHPALSLVIPSLRRDPTAASFLSFGPTFDPGIDGFFLETYLQHMTLVRDLADGVGASDAVAATRSRQAQFAAALYDHPRRGLFLAMVEAL